MVHREADRGSGMSFPPGIGENESSVVFIGPRISAPQAYKGRGPRFLGGKRGGGSSDDIDDADDYAHDGVYPRKPWKVRVQHAAARSQERADNKHAMLVGDHGNSRKKRLDPDYSATGSQVTIGIAHAVDGRGREFPLDVLLSKAQTPLRTVPKPAVTSSDPRLIKISERLKQNLGAPPITQVEATTESPVSPLWTRIFEANKAERNSRGKQRR